MKDEFWQEVRGLCIIAVIMIHIPRGSFENGSFDYWLSFRQIINFPVATFIFLSGYFAITTNNNFSIYSRLKRIGIPYLVWTTIYTLTLAIISLHNETEYLSIERILKNYIMGDASGHLYFIVVLIQLIIITPFLIKAIKKNKTYINIICWLTTPIYLLWIYYYYFNYGKTPPLDTILFPAWFIFYYLGIKIKSQKISLKSQPLFILICILFFLIISCWESKLILTSIADIGFAVAQIKISSILYTVALILLLCMLNKQVTSHSTNLLCKIGNASFGIYLIHMIVLRPIYFIVSRLELNIYSFFIMQILATIIILTISYFVVIIINKIAPPYISKFIGFR